MLAFLSGHWPWYVTGPVIGLFVPLLLLVGNKQFGVSSSFRHVCTVALRPSADYFKYDWKAESWNLFFVAGIVLGGAIAVLFLNGNQGPAVTQTARQMFTSWGVGRVASLDPPAVFSLSALADPRNVLMLIAGGFLIGFGTRYANGCTSGHTIMGLSLLNLGSLVASASFFIGGLIVSNFVVPALFT